MVLLQKYGRKAAWLAAAAAAAAAALACGCW